LRSLQAYLSTHHYIRMLRTKASKPISRDNVPTATLHSDLSNSKTTTAPTPKVTIHAHQATNSALPKLMNIVYRALPMAASAARVATAWGKNRARRGRLRSKPGNRPGAPLAGGAPRLARLKPPEKLGAQRRSSLPYRLVPQVPQPELVPHEDQGLLDVV
jgi:hypothetical protein